MLTKKEKTYKYLSESNIKHFYHSDVICTPFSLIEEIINKLPEELFKNKETKFLDPCCGRGAFLLVLKFKLLEYGHSEKHIVENMLFGVDIQGENVQFSSSIIGLNKFKVNIMQGDSLKDELFKGMKFDCVVGNPPYQEGGETNKHKNQKKERTGRLYEKFFFKLFQQAKNYGIILPSGFLGKPGRLKDSVLNDKGVCCLVETTNRFNIALATCAIIKVSNFNSILVDCILGSGEVVNIKKTNFLTFEETKFPELTSKIKNLSPLSDLWQNNQMLNRSMDIYVDKGKYKVVSIVGDNKTQVPIFLYTNDDRVLKQQHINSFKVVINYNAGLTTIGVAKIVPPNSYVTGNVVFFPTQDKTTAENLVSYLNSSLVKFIAKKYRSSSLNSYIFFKNVPQVDFTRSWTNEELYEHFNLTQEEILLIENTVK